VHRSLFYTTGARSRHRPESAAPQLTAASSVQSTWSVAAALAKDGSASGYGATEGHRDESLRRLSTPAARSAGLTVLPAAG